MSFKFFVGQAVEYTPIGEKTAGLYKITMLIPAQAAHRNEMMSPAVTE
jgi:hypothetical protein